MSYRSASFPHGLPVLEEGVLLHVRDPDFRGHAGGDRVLRYRVQHEGIRADDAPLAYRNGTDDLRARRCDDIVADDRPLTRRLSEAIADGNVLEDREVTADRAEATNQRTLAVDDLEARPDRGRVVDLDAGQEA